MKIPGFIAELSAGGSRGHYAGSSFAHSSMSASIRLQLRKRDATQQACCCGTGTKDEKCIDPCERTFCRCDETGTPYCSILFVHRAGISVSANSSRSAQERGAR